MDGTRLSNFSIDHILSSGVGQSSQTAPESFQNVGCLPEQYFQGIPTGFNLDYGTMRPALRPLGPLNVVPPLVPACVSYRGLDPGNRSFFTCGPCYLHHSAVYPNSAGHRVREEPGPPGPPGLQQTAVVAPRQRSRLRTVFTETQTKHLETLFQFTDYPGVEVRAELARSTGLTEETVRVWFKNRRARRKRQRSGSKVKSPSRRPAGSMKEASGHVFLSDSLFTAFL